MTRKFRKLDPEEIHPSQSKKRSRGQNRQMGSEEFGHLGSLDKFGQMGSLDKWGKRLDGAVGLLEKGVRGVVCAIWDNAQMGYLCYGVGG